MVQESLEHSGLESPTEESLYGGPGFQRISSTPLEQKYLFVCTGVCERASPTYSTSPSPKVAQFRDYRGLPLAMVSPAGGRVDVSEHLAPSGVRNAPSGAPVLPAPSRDLNCELQDESQ